MSTSHSFCGVPMPLREVVRSDYSRANGGVDNFFYCRNSRSQSSRTLYQTCTKLHIPGTDPPPMPWVEWHDSPSLLPPVYREEDLNPGPLNCKPSNCNLNPGPFECWAGAITTVLYHRESAYCRLFVFIFQSLMLNS